MDVATLAWLRSDPGTEALSVARQLRDDNPSALRLGEELRRRYTPAQAAATLALLELRARAEGKFGRDAAQMFFTREALEQATRREVANYRANRLARHGVRSVLDLGCGLGGDLIALARADIEATGVDLDDLRVALAAANVASLGLAAAVHHADGTILDRSGFDVVFADPARRSGSGRTFNPHAFTPSWTFVEGLLQQRAVVKLAPGLPHELVPAGVEAEWVSWAGELKEAGLWSGNLATSRRRATALTPEGAVHLTSEDDPGAPAIGTGPMLDFAYEPDPAVIRAHLVTAFASQIGGTLVDPNIAYVTSPRPTKTALGRGYRVLEELPYHPKHLKAALQHRDVGALTVKKRGVDVVPEQLRQRLALRGTQAATVILTRVAGKGACFLVEPL